jgi:hypothetical protein
MAHKAHSLKSSRISQDDIEHGDEQEVELNQKPGPFEKGFYLPSKPTPYAYKLQTKKGTNVGRYYWAQYDPVSLEVKFICWAEPEKHV